MKTQRYLSAREFGERLSISHWTVYQMIYDGRIQAEKIGRLVRIPESEIQHLLQRQGRTEAGHE